MTTKVKSKDKIAVKQFITDKKGHKVAAVIDMEELDRIKELWEDLSDLKTIEDRKDEPVEDYEAYSRKRKSRLSV